ncbi:MAG TPA: adenylate/guanylate cyclase domain-containing protein, partial [Usitatibacter sp.]|nr:adenylate/guanylate cyclase domain-containing protein [Usitatibacter sp.]
KVRVFAGNLIGPVIYTVIEALAEGPAFFGFLHHYEYWAFAGAIGALRAGREHVPGKSMASFMMIAEGVVRSSILLAMYATFEIESTAADATGATLGFFDDRSHTFIAWAIMLLGVVAGVYAATSQRYLVMLRSLSRQLRVYSEWFFGPVLLEQAVTDPSSLALARRERAILFMDMRGFTAWSETQSPETVVAGLGLYYQTAEQVFDRHRPIRSKFSADEIMAVFASAPEALAAAGELAAAQRETLRVRGLGAGIGLHWGPVVEGLIGGRAIKQFDVVGDTVNTAKRIEGEAAPGEILASEAFRAASGGLSRGERRVQVKGKSVPLAVHTLAGLTAIKPREARA